MEPAAYEFAIDAAGRTLSIAPRDNGRPPFADDVAPALAASRFPANAPRSHCRVLYTPQSYGLDEAPVADLVSYSITPIGPRLPRAGWDRIRAAGDCADRPRPRPLVRAFPDFDEVPATRGVKDWSLVAYDTDAKGAPVKLAIAQSTGNAQLDAAAVKAVRQSRFTEGKRTGCRYPYWRAAGKLPAPETPGKDAYRPDGATCTETPRWAVRPTLRFPEAYRRRSIEGWAIITYDVASWGEIGNIAVAASQPSSDFGEQAMAVLRSARAEASQAGATGCVDVVRFAMRSDESSGGEGIAAEDGDAPLQ